MKNQYKTPNLIKTQYSDQKCLNIMDFNNENPNLVTDEDTLEEGNENQNSTNSAEDTITLDSIFQLEQPLDLSLHCSSTSNLTDTSSGSLFNFGNPILLKTNAIINKGNTPHNKVLYNTSNATSDKQNLYPNTEISPKDEDFPPAYLLNDQGHLLRNIDSPSLSEVNYDKRPKQIMHRKHIPLYARPEPDDPEEQIRWHRARATEKHHRKRNRQATRVIAERDTLKAQLQAKCDIINEISLKLTNAEARTVTLQATNSKLKEKVANMNAELVKKQERIDDQWLLFQTLLKK